MPGNIQVDTVDDPRIEDPGDVILKVSSTAICGSDLHILHGSVPQFGNMIMGHEFMGTVVEAGNGVSKLKAGDRVVVPFPAFCAIRPTGPEPNIATTSPPFICAQSMALQPVGKMSVRKSTCSSVMLSGTARGPKSA